MKSYCIAHPKSPVTGKTYQWIKKKYKGIKIYSIERIILKEINNLKKHTRIKQGDFLVVEGKPADLSEIGEYDNYNKETESIKDKIERFLNSYKY